MKKVSTLVIILAIFFSCKQENSIENEISQIDVDVKIERFDLAYGNSSVADLTKLKETFPFFIFKTHNRFHMV